MRSGRNSTRNPTGRGRQSWRRTLLCSFRVIEVPLNFPELIESIRRLRQSLPTDCLVGAGTVYRPAQVAQLRAAGGQLIVMPHGDHAVIASATAAQLDVLPGVATPTESFAVFGTGTTVMKFFPADHLAGPRGTQSMGLCSASGNRPHSGRRYPSGKPADFHGCRGRRFRCEIDALQTGNDQPRACTSSR